MFGLKNKKSLVVGFLTAILLMAGFFVVAPALAQVNTGIEFGQYTGLVDTDIRIIVAKIIRVALGLLGIIVLVYTLYGGYIYLTAGGDTDKTKEAKTVLKNAVIGLAIILSAFSITQFVLSSLTGSIINNYCASNPGACVNCVNNPTDPACSVSTTCQTNPGSCPTSGQVFYSTVSPQGNSPIYNLVVDIQFSGAFGHAVVKRDTVTAGNIGVFKRLTDGSFQPSSHSINFEFKTDSKIALHPVGDCGEGITTNDCYEKNTTYKVVLQNSVQSVGGASLDCVNHTCETLFTTGDRYDALPPVVTMVLPGNGAIVGNNRNTSVSASYSDDSGVKGVAFNFKDKENTITSIYDFLLNPFEATGSKEFNAWVPPLLDSETAEIVDVFATAFDLDNHWTTSAAQQVKIVPAYCFNGVLDTVKNEQQVHSVVADPSSLPDCGLRSECGACSGDFCDTNFDCAGTYCNLTSHTCVARPKILGVSPLTAGAGSLVTVQGVNFGTTPGSVLFNGTPADVVACTLTGNSPSWYNNAVIVRVPTGTNTSGTIELRTTGYSGTTDLAHFDTTAVGDNWGNPASFITNSSLLPGLSCLYPRDADPGSYMEIAGENLGTIKGGVNFASLLVTGADITQWWQISNKKIIVVVPRMPAQTLSLNAITSAGLPSNFLPFTVNSVTETSLPVIDFIDPTDGPVGTFVTIAGRNFGQTGEVIFKTSDGAATGVTADLPSCADSWTPTQIIVKVPSGLILGNYFIQVKKSAVDVSNTKLFVVNNFPLQPGLCKITPSSGPATTEVTILGQGFGNQTPASKVEFWQGVTSTAPISWTDLQIKDSVPTTAKTGGVKVWVGTPRNLYSSNSLNFKVQNCKEELNKGKILSEVCTGVSEKCCGDGTCNTACAEDVAVKSSIFAWSFTSGQFPVVPRVLEQCGKFCAGTTKTCNSNTDCSNQVDISARNCQVVVPSPSPALKWPGSNAVCVNAGVNILFNTPVKNNNNPLVGSVPQETFFVYKCLNASCSLDNLSQVLPGSYGYNSGLQDRIFFTPLPQLGVNTTYQAILTTNIRSIASPTSLEANMVQDSSCPKISDVYPGKNPSYCFKFTTSNTNALCKIGDVVVSPVVYTTSTLSITKSDFYSAIPLATGNLCIGLNSNDYDWRWNPSDESSATLNNLTASLFSSISNKMIGTKVSGVNQDLTIKSQPTSRAEIITATWNDDPDHAVFADKIKGTAYLNLLPQRPRVVENYPNCNSACTNATIGYKFDIPVKEASGALRFYKCNNASCSLFSEPSIASGQFIGQEIIGGQWLSKGFKFSANLDPNSLYKVVIQSYVIGRNTFGVRSFGNAILDPQYITVGEPGFAWMFRTKDDSSGCSVESVEIEPATATVKVIGATAEYQSIAKGKPDACSPQGQILSKDTNGLPFNWGWQSLPANVATISQLDRGARLLGSTALTAYCGNKQVDNFEECDPTSLPNSTCAINCHTFGLGTSACTATNKVQCCGNGGAAEFNEQCDLGVLNGLPGSSCTFNCLQAGSPISLNYCLAQNLSVLNITDRKADCLNKWGAVAVCGNGGAVEDGEECDLGAANGAGGGTCSSKCLLTAKQFASVGADKCGNGIVEPDPGATGNNEQCDGQIGCGSDCRWEFVGDGKIDPLQYARAVGLGPINLVTKQQLARINATTLTKTGTADFILQCGYSPVDSGCPSSTNLNQGAGSDSCCYPRPGVITTSAVSGVATWPRPGYISGICPNTRLAIRFDQAMDEKSFTSTTLGYYNIVLAESVPTASCPQGTYRVGYEEKQPQNFWQRITFTVRHWFGMPVTADNYCAGGLNYDLETKTDLQTINSVSVSSTVVTLLLKEPLDTFKIYRLLATKDVRNSLNVRMQDPWFIDFSTAGQMCKISQLTVDPESYAFTVKGEQKSFTAKPEFVSSGIIGAPAQPLIQYPNIYDWVYNWVDGDGAVDRINVGPANNNPTIVTALDKNGNTTVIANLRITADGSANSTVNKVFSATSTISVFLCENPWPSSVVVPGLGLGYFDAANNSNAILSGHGWTNFKLQYCRDAGAENITTDDLSALTLNAPLYHLADSSGILKEFFFTFDSLTNKNSIGLRVYPNLNHLSIADWYKSQPWIPKGAPVPTTIGADDHVYEALQEGRTYYINGLNTNGNNVYTNVYVLAFSDNPTSETLNILPQLLSNFTLNVNELGSPNKVAALMRDFTRFKDLKVMSDKLSANYNTNGYFPKLDDKKTLGTFLPAYTNSKWLSWQLLNNSLGFGLPTDPINKFYGCGSSTLFVGTSPNVVSLGLFDSETCWNATSSTFACLAGSHIYQYQTKGGLESTIKADFEETTVDWQNELTSLLNVKLCSLTKSTCKTNSDCYQQKCADNKCELTGTACTSDTMCAGTVNTCNVNGLTFETENSCTGAVQGIGGACGDGIVGPTEDCEIGQIKYESCSVTGGYEGKQLFRCQNNCAWPATGEICIAQGKCGDGIKQANEDCDAGSNNGKYGYGCSLLCAVDLVNNTCGNNQVDTGNEVCDFSSATHPSPAQYSINANNSCSWDCQGRDYCGDGKVNTAFEECEASESCQVGTCNLPTFLEGFSDLVLTGGKYCENDTQCNTLIKQSDNTIIAKPFCNSAKVCSTVWTQDEAVVFPDLIPAGDQISCNTDADCQGSCVNKVSGKKYCRVTGEQKYNLLFKNGLPYFADATSTAYIDPTRVLQYTERTVPTTDSNKTCQWERANVNSTYFSSPSISCLPTKLTEIPVSQLNCGIDADNDGNFKDPGEQCDFGTAANGDICVPGSGVASCTFCDFGCTNKTVSSQYTVTVNFSPAGSSPGAVTKNPDRASYFLGDKVSLTANPFPGWEFIRWEGEVENINLNPSTTTLNKNQTILAIFNQLAGVTRYNLITSVSAGGTIKVTPDTTSFPEGTMVTLQAVPDLNYIFSGWSGDGPSGIQNEVTIQMTSNKNVRADFVPKVAGKYTLAISVDPPNGGVVIQSGVSNLFNPNEWVALTAEASPGYTFSHWSGNLPAGTLTTLGPISFRINQDTNLTAHFTAPLTLICPGASDFTISAVDSNGDPVTTQWGLLWNPPSGLSNYTSAAVDYLNADNSYSAVLHNRCGLTGQTYGLLGMFLDPNAPVGAQEKSLNCLKMQPFSLLPPFSVTDYNFSSPASGQVFLLGNNYSWWYS